MPELVLLDCEIIPYVSIMQHGNYMALNFEGYHVVPMQQAKAIL
jgi:hypothetical protein